MYIYEISRRKVSKEQPYQNKDKQAFHLAIKELELFLIA